MQNKKAAGYGELGSRRKLGNHLPRIASGDAEDIGEENVKVDSPPPKRPTGIREEKEPISPVRPRKREPFTLNVTNTDDVAGIPGRIRLSRNKIPQAPVPLPSSRLTRGLWADQQRQFIQAYEYLCHVGEAQQWIEGCLGEELGFGVVEMEEGLRNGVVLAKLVRVFEGESVVKRIYEVRVVNIPSSS
jgi:Ras GTPase-activating-like protein IQGAP2/3